LEGINYKLVEYVIEARNFNSYGGLKMRKKVECLVNNLKQRNIDAFYFDDIQQANEKIIELIPNHCTVGFGNSQTLKNMNITKLLSDRGCIVYDKTIAENKDEITKLKKKSLLADWYITGTNAISLQGQLVNIDHSGNRVAAMIYGPDKVIVVVGTNKIVDSLDDAIKRARNTAAPANAKRAGLNPPCISIGACVDCRSAERACNNLVVIEGQHVKDRMKVFIINESLGY
jgi:L-lactate utilization protein LutB